MNLNFSSTISRYVYSRKANPVDIKVWLVSCFQDSIKMVYCTFVVVHESLNDINCLRRNNIRSCMVIKSRLHITLLHNTTRLNSSMVEPSPYPGAYHRSLILQWTQELYTGSLQQSNSFFIRNCVSYSRHIVL